jgi:hypothetical protein
MYTLLGNLRRSVRLAADMRLSDLRYPINFVVKHQNPLFSRRTSPEAVETCLDPKLVRIAACFQVEALFEEGAELDAVNEVGGADRDRTGDPLLAKQVLSQLSYSPLRVAWLRWWAWVESNYRPHPYQGCALTN